MYWGIWGVGAGRGGQRVEPLSDGAATCLPVPRVMHASQARRPVSGWMNEAAAWRSLDVLLQGDVPLAERDERLVELPTLPL